MSTLKELNDYLRQLHTHRIITMMILAIATGEERNFDEVVRNEKYGNEFDWLMNNNAN